MENLVWGIVVFILGVILTFFAFRAYTKNRPQLSLLLVVSVGFILRVYISMDQHLHEWDERYHALVGKNYLGEEGKPLLYKNPVIAYDKNDWIANHIWLSKGPVPLIAIGAAVKVFGNKTFAVRIPSIILGCFAIILTFFIGKYLFNLKVGLIAAFLHSIHGLSIELIGGRVSSDHVETFFIFFVELALFLSIFFIKFDRRRVVISILIGITVAFAVLCKWVPALLVFPVWMIAAYFNSKLSLLYLLKNLIISLTAFTICLLPYFLYLDNNFHDEFLHLIQGVVSPYNDVIQNHSAPWYYYLYKIFVIFGEFLIFPIGLAFYLLYKNKERWKMALLCSWWLIPLIVFSFAETKRFTYLMICAPAFFVLIAFSIYALNEKITFVKSKILITLFSILLIAMPLRYTIERTKIFEKRENNKSWMAEIELMNQLEYNRENTIICNFPHHIEAMFYTDFTVYPKKILEKDKNDLIREGYMVLIYNQESQKFE